MIRHVLLFRFNEDVGETTRTEAVERLRQLGELCPTIGKWSVGTNITDSPSAYDMIEIGNFASQEAFEAYKDHPAHREFADFIRPLATWALGDYEEEEPAVHLLRMAQEIPPISLPLRGASYRYSGKGNDAYQNLKYNLRELVGDSIAASQLGRVMVKLVTGRLPKGMFAFTPQVGVTYTGALQTPGDIDQLKKHVGDKTADRLLLVFHALATKNSVLAETGNL